MALQSNIDYKNALHMFNENNEVNHLNIHLIESFIWIWFFVVMFFFVFHSFSFVEILFAWFIPSKMCIAFYAHKIKWCA